MWLNQWRHLVAAGLQTPASPLSELCPPPPIHTCSVQTHSMGKKKLSSWYLSASDSGGNAAHLPCRWRDTAAEHQCETDVALILNPVGLRQGTLRTQSLIKAPRGRQAATVPELAFKPSSNPILPGRSSLSSSTRS